MTKKKEVPQTTDIRIKLDPKIIARLSAKAKAEGFKLTPWAKAKFLRAVGEL